LSIEERRSAERAFAESKDCVIVSTSTLELGIDVGDLDRVIQIDAPNTVASFLQRLGRTGRRPDTSRNCLFLATSPKALLRAAALLCLWESGFVEPVVAPPEPIHLLSQQIMALALQEGGIGECDWRAWVGRLPAFASLEASQTEALLDHLKEEKILFSDGGILGFGAEGESLFGRRHFLELLAVFSTPSTLTVLSGLREIGPIESGYLFRSQQAGPLRIVLGGGGRCRLAPKNGPSSGDEGKGKRRVDWKRTRHESDDGPRSADSAELGGGACTMERACEDGDGTAEQGVQLPKLGHQHAGSLRTG
jgi:ATP-dependent Lhr-like helicase